MNDEKKVVFSAFADAYSPEFDVHYDSQPQELSVLDDLPNNLMDLGLFYKHLRFSKNLIMDGVFVNIAIYDDLPKRAKGWARTYDFKNNTWTINSKWKPDWVVFATLIDASCIFADVASEGCPVFGVIAGSLEPVKISESFLEFLRIMTAMVEVERMLGFKVMNRKEEPTKKFLANLDEEVSKICSPEIKKNFFSCLL